MASVTWMWFGNQPQINANSGTPLTSADAAKMVGYQATGGTQIKPVTVSGASVTLQTDEGRAEAFRTTYNTGWALPSSLTYASPTTDLPPPTARHHVRGPRVRRLAERHAAKQRPIVSRL